MCDNTLPGGRTVAFDEQGTQAEAPRFDTIYRGTEMVSKPQILIHTLGCCPWQGQCQASFMVVGERHCLMRTGLSLFNRVRRGQNKHTQDEEHNEIVAFCILVTQGAFGANRLAVATSLL